MEAENRYQSHILLKGFGINGQTKLSETKVLVIGCGGLGCPILQTLSASGIGKIGLADGDRVGITNLSRQFLFKPSDLGKMKTVVAKENLSKLNTEIEFFEYPNYLNQNNALNIISAYDIIVDGTDNFESRYLLNDACLLAGKPLVFGAVSQYEGQLGVWNLNLGDHRSAHYRDAFPKYPREKNFLNCADLGVLGTLTGIIGNLMAAEVIKIATQIGTPLHDKLWTYNLLNNQSYTFKIKPLPAHSDLPGSPEAFENMDYGVYCAGGERKNREKVNFISAKDFICLIDQKDLLILDVREYGESPKITTFDHRNMPLSSLEDQGKNILEDTIITLCWSGNRSEKAAQKLNKIYKNQKSIFSLDGGLKDLTKNFYERTSDQS